MGGRFAAWGHASEHSSLRQEKYLPVPPGGFSIGPGTNKRMMGNRRNFWPRLKSSRGGNFRNPAINGPPSTKSLFPSTITDGSRLAKRKSNWRSVGVMGMPGRTLVLNCAGGSPAHAVSADTKQSRKIVVFIRPLSPGTTIHLNPVFANSLLADDAVGKGSTRLWRVVCGVPPQTSSNQLLSPTVEKDGLTKSTARRRRWHARRVRSPFQLH